jgi:hypothetical protein
LKRRRLQGRWLENEDNRRRSSRGHERRDDQDEDGLYPLFYSCAFLGDVDVRHPPVERVGGAERVLKAAADVHRRSPADLIGGMILR